MPLARVNGCVLHFIHIPKTGGSSVNSYLRTRGDLALYSRDPLDWMQVSPQHLHRSAALRVLPPGFCDAEFTILRDPVQRIRSEYRYRAARLAQASGQTSSAVEWHDGRAFGDGFEAWVKAVLRDWNHNPCLYDNHIRPQSDFWRPGIKTFLFEDGLGQVFDWIDRVAGLPDTGPHIHENPGAAIEVSLSRSIEGEIREFYRADICLIERIKKARAAPAAPDFRIPVAAFKPAAGHGSSAE